MSDLAEKTTSSWQSVLIKIVRPIARFALRHGVKIQDIQQALNQVMIDEANSELKSRGTLQNVSRISVMTGIHRREVSRLLEDSPAKHSVTLISKVIGQWQHAKKYCTSDGAPRALSAGFDDSEFNELVRSVSKELNPASVMFDLERTGVVELQHGKLQLKKGAYSPPQNFEAGVEILGADINDLIVAVEENLTKDEEKNLHARTVFDALRTDILGELKQWVRREGHEFHRRVREKFSQYDQDINPDLTYQGGKARVIVGSFSRFEQE